MYFHAILRVGGSKAGVNMWSPRQATSNGNASSRVHRHGRRGNRRHNRSIRDTPRGYARQLSRKSGKVLDWCTSHKISSVLKREPISAAPENRAANDLQLGSKIRLT